MDGIDFNIYNECQTNTPTPTPNHRPKKLRILIEDWFVLITKKKRMSKSIYNLYKYLYGRLFGYCDYSEFDSILDWNVLMKALSKFHFLLIY